MNWPDFISASREQADTFFGGPGGPSYSQLYAEIGRDGMPDDALQLAIMSGYRRHQQQESGATAAADRTHPGYVGCLVIVSAVSFDRYQTYETKPGVPLAITDPSGSSTEHALLVSQQGRWTTFDGGPIAWR